MDLGTFRTVAACCAAVTLLLACGTASPTGSSSTPTLLPTSTPSPPPLRLVVLGDSIASGTSAGGQGTSGWPAIVAQRLGLLLLMSAQPGTGYTKDFGAG